MSSDVQVALGILGVVLGVGFLLWKIANSGDAAGEAVDAEYQRVLKEGKVKR